MYTRLTGLLLLISLLLLSGLPLAAQETMAVRPGEAAPAFACAEEDCERLAWLPAGANVTLIAEVEGRTLEDNGLWYEVLLDCPCFDYEHRFLENAPVMSVSATGSWTLWQPRWSPDGARIAAAVDTDLYVWDAATGTLLTQEPLAPFNLLPPAWSPDGTQILYALTGNLRGRLKRWGGTEQERPRTLVDSRQGILNLSLSPAGRFLVVGIEGAVRILDAATGRTLADLARPGEQERFFGLVQWSPDGRRIAAAGTQYSRRVAVGTRQSSVELWDLTLIPEGPTRAFIHSSRLTTATTDEG